jgi:hypothetical protein
VEPISSRGPRPRKRRRRPRVKAALALSSTVSAFDIDVDTQGETVRLRGQVPSEEVRDLAVAIAKDTLGVDSVTDELLIDPAARPCRAEAFGEGGPLALSACATRMLRDRTCGHFFSV